MNANSLSWKHELQLLLNLAIPTVVIQLGSVLPNFLVASYVGRIFGPTFLDGFTLANLMGNLCNLSLLQGLYTSADTLSPQAYGAGNLKEVGYIAIRGYIASLIVLVPINVVLVEYFKPLLVAVGEDAKAAAVAQQWYRIYVFGLPFYALYMVTWKFLSAQEVMKPLVVVCLVCCLLILPVTLEFMTRWYGYVGSAWSIVLYQVAEALLLILYLKWFQPHTPGTWNGLRWRDVLHLEPFRRYFWLGLGGMLASSKWIYWECLSLLIGTLGIVPLSVHTIPTQVLMVGFMLPLGIGIALSVRLGSTLPRSVSRAKRLAGGTCLASSLLFFCIALAIYFGRDRVFKIFTTDKEVLDGCERIWWKVAVYYFNLSLYGINMGVATGLGMQWTFGIVTIVFLWGLSLPSMYYFAILNGGGLDWAWTTIYVPYIFMNAYFGYILFMKTDWGAIHLEIRRREGMDKEDTQPEEEMVPSESTRLLS